MLIYKLLVIFCGLYALGNLTGLITTHTGGSTLDRLTVTFLWFSAAMMNYSHLG